MVETKKERFDDDDERITEPEHLRKLFIGGLDYGTTEESLKGYFEKWGKIVDVVVMKDTKKKRSRGFGFVTYSQSYMIDDAQAERPHKIDGRVVEPKRAVPRQEIDSPSAGASIKRLFVGGLRDDHDEECLRDYFSQFGNIVDVDLISEKETGKKRGFAFVEYDDYDPVDKIVLQKSHTINNKLINVKKAISKQDMDRSNNRGGQGGRGSGGGGGGRGNDRGGNWGGNDRNHNDNWGGNNGNFGSNFGNFGNNGGGGGGFGNNGGGGNWNNGPSPWDNGNNSGGGGNWNSNGGSGFGGNQGGNWGGNNNSFDDDYQQNFGGGPQRSNFSSNRPTPYGNNQGGGMRGGSFNKGGNQGGMGGGFGSSFNGGGMMGGGNRRY